MTGIQLVTSDELTAAVSSGIATAVPTHIAGATILHKFSFDFSLADLTDGVTFWTPRVGEVVMTFWLIVTEAWNGTTPNLDVGSFQGSSTGWFSYQNGIVDLTSITPTDSAGAGITFATNVDIFPGPFTTTDPIKVVISQNGEQGGSDPESSQGHATFYWTTAMPVTG